MELLVTFIVTLPMLLYVVRLEDPAPRPDLAVMAMSATVEPVTAAAAPPPEAISFEGLVQHFVEQGVVQTRLEDGLPPDRPLAPHAPEPHLLALSSVIPLLPKFPVEVGTEG